MELLRQLPPFLVAIFVLASIPGPGVALLVRRCSTGGVRAGLPVIAGLETGLYLWIVAAGAGLAALLAASHPAYLALRIVGGGFLVVLGLHAWRSALRCDPAPEPHPVARLATASRSGRGTYLLGVLTNTTNPKVGIFAFAFYPQFVPAGYPVLITTAALGMLQISLEFGYYLGLAAVVGRAGTWLGRGRVRRVIDAVSGTVLLGLGLRVAVRTAVPGSVG